MGNAGVIANFVLMGDLYQHNPFDFLATEWSTYPWQIGFDNGMEISSTEVVRSPMSKTNWDAGLFDDQVLDLGVSADISSAVMFAALVIFDIWGNIGSDAGTDPASIPDDSLILSDSVVVGSATSEQTIFPPITLDSNSEEDTDLIAASSVTISNVTSSLMMIVFDSNSEEDTDLIAANSVTISNVTSSMV